MTTFQIEADEKLVSAIRRVAEERSVPVEELIRQVLHDYLQDQPPSAPRYSFIGIGQSGKGDLSERVDELLEKSANRRAGWTLPG